MAMTVKEQLIEMLREAGYDYFTAAEEATKRIEEFLASGEKSVTLYAQGAKTSVTLTRKKP